MTGPRKNVLLLIKGLGPGGAENLLLAAAPYLDRDRFNYSIAYFLPWKDALVEPLVKEGIRVHCVRQASPYDLRAIYSLVRLLRKEKVDILHAHLPYAGIIGRVAARLGGVETVVYSEHNVWERYRKLTLWANRMTFKMNDAVIAVSEEVERSIRRGLHFNGRPALDTILNGVDVGALSRLERNSTWLKHEFGIPQDHRLVVNVANFKPQKRHADLLEAASIVVANREDVTFLLVGQGPLEADIRWLSTAKGLDSRVVFTGFRPDAKQVIAASDVFVLSSQFEGLPVSLLEAMATGTPAVSTAVGGVPEVITHEHSGLLVEPRSPELLALAIMRMLDDDELCQTLAVNARSVVAERFGVSRMVHETEKLYEAVSAGASR